MAKTDMYIAKHAGSNASSCSKPMRLNPLVEALTIAAFGIAVLPMAADAAGPVSGAWFATPQSSSAGRIARPGVRPGAEGADVEAATIRQQQTARQKLQQSVANLERTASAIAAQQAAQSAARDAASIASSGVPDGLVQGGLWDRDEAGNKLQWTGAERAVHTRDGSRHNVAIKQTASKAILNWDTFNVGRDTTVEFQQNNTDAVLNRVVGAEAKPSQILGAIKGDGTVMLVNQNGVIFTGSSQVNVRNLVVAAGAITDSQFADNGLYVNASGSQPTFRDALGVVEVESGAQITTHKPTSSTDGGGYVMLLGKQVHSAGQITTVSGQTVLAAGDSFYIRKGVGTDGNTKSTTSGNEVSVGLKAGSDSGQVVNTGLITATSGDITMTGHDVTQAGVVVASTSTSRRGTIHLSSRASDATGRVTFAEGSTTAVLLDESGATALDSQRDAALAGLNDAQVNPLATGNFDNLSTTVDRSDLSRIEVVSGNTVEFQRDSMTIATGGEIVVSAVKRTLVDTGAQLDVSGAIGVKVAMEANNLNINVQGNEQRDSPVNREDGSLNSSEVWVDRRSLILVPAGTNGYETDRWYTAGGLLEVSGYLATSGHSVGEWMAQGGTVTVTGGDLVTRAGSNINISGGTLDVQSGYIGQSWLKGADGRLYELSHAPGDVLYTGLYQGYEATSERWGHTDYYYSPLIGASKRYEPGYTVGRDAGKLVVATSNAVLEGAIINDVYQGDRQINAAQPGLDGYYQSQDAVARRGQLIIGQYLPRYDEEANALRHTLSALLDRIEVAKVDKKIAAGLVLDSDIEPERQGVLVLDTDLLNDMELGALRVAARESILVNDSLQVSPGGEIVLYGPQVNVSADLIARSGGIHVGNVLNQFGLLGGTFGFHDFSIAVPGGMQGGVRLREGVTLDARGMHGDLRDAQAQRTQQAYANGGTVSIRSTKSVTLEPNSVIDVSAGAVVREDASIAGGRGGSVRLGTGVVDNDPTAVLTLDGSIRGYGVTGSGTLDIESGSAVTIGGKLLEADGVLGAGEVALADLILLVDYEVKAGEILPVDYTYVVDMVGPGEVVNALLASGVQYTLAADWQLPGMSGSGNYQVMDTTGRLYTIRSNTDPLPIIPAGTTIYFQVPPQNFPNGYVVPGDVFPNGLKLLEGASKTIAAGSIAPADFLVAAGTRLSAGTVLARSGAVADTTTLSTDLFQSGFSHYNVRGYNGLVIPDGVTLDVLQPVLQANNQSPSTVGTESYGFLHVLLPEEIYHDNPQRRTVDQRQGASLTLAGGLRDSGGGALYIGKDASLRVDPGQSIELSSRGNLTVQGLLRANGGTLRLMGPQSPIAGTELRDGTNVGDEYYASILIGEHAVLDASAVPYVTYDPLGRPYGIVSEGGSIVIGGELLESVSRAPSSNAFVVIQQGAVVDVSGAQADMDIDGRGVRTLASDGGSIQVASSNGLYLDGILRAYAGGAGASGGHLTVALDAPNYANSVGDSVRVARELVLVQESKESALDNESDLAFGHARLGVNQVEDGGFSSLSLFSNGVVSFGGDVDLQMARELRIYSGALTVADGIDPTIHVSLSAPYVLLAGIADSAASRDGYMRPSVQGGITTLPSEAGLTVLGDLIDVKGTVNLGLNDTMAQQFGTLQVDRAGFNALALSSSGDLRFVSGADLGGSFDAQLLSSGDILLRAEQVYPATGVNARVQAGLVGNDIYAHDSHLVIERAEGSDMPQLPYSVFGNLTLGADTIEQNGVLRAPLGTLTLGTSTNQNFTGSVVLGADSVTSISAAGLVMPYGGTADGVSYQYQGREVTLHGVGSTLEGVINLVGSNIDVEKGAFLDLSGGGDLQGAGFVPGRGGSTDARYSPLVQTSADGFTLPGLASNPVYAIVPGYASLYAPADGTGAVIPLIGQQVTIQAGDIPGLAAGTYTLLPSSYALLPGAFRVEINGAATGWVSASAVAMRNGSYAASGVLGAANTGIADSLASQLIITPSDVLRTYSQYNETSYSDFVLLDAERRGVPRAILPEDGKQLLLRFPAGESGSPLNFDGLADFSAAQDGYGGVVSLTSSLGGAAGASFEILAANAAPTEGFDGLSFYADDLNAFGAARTTIGGRINVEAYSSGTSRNEANYLDMAVTASDVVLREGAVLRAPEVFLMSNDANGSITIESGAGINTIGMGDVAYDSTFGYIYRPGAASVLAASNGWLDVLSPDVDTQSAGAGSILIGIGGGAGDNEAELYSEGTLVGVTNKTFELGDAVRYGTRNLVLAVGAVNAGSNENLTAAAARGALSSGLTLNQTVLDRLLQGDTTYGAPALERLVLTAGESFNFFGDVSLNTIDATTGKSALANLVLSTPAIYGYGDAGDVATISTGKLTWVGTDGEAPAPIIGGRGTGAGSLVVNAEVVELGYDASARPSGIDNFDRTILGFGDVHFAATDRITANNKGSLSVYQSLVSAGGDGPQYQGGNLTLTAPLVTGAGGSVNSITAGGTLQVLAPESGAADASAVTLNEEIETGAELNLAASSILIDSTVALPSGKLTATAEGDITLGDSAYLDLSGRAIAMYDTTSYSWGGDVILQSTVGNITQAAGSTLDLSAEYNNAGFLTAVALDEGAGRVSLQGTLLGSASGHYDAGGTEVPYRAGGVNIRAQHLGSGGTLTDEFVALNTQLNEGGLTGERSFQFKQGDLTIGDELKANEINVSLDGGHLTVDGTVNASGEKVGSIRLAGKNGLTLGGNAVLDAHSSVLRVDSYGKIIDSPNRAVVELSSGDGQLTLAEGARIDLRHGVGENGQLDALHDGRDRGTLELNAPRLGGATAGDIAIDASSRLDIHGVKSIAVYGVQRYDDAQYGTDEAASSRPYQVVDQDYLNGKHQDNTDFIDAALLNSDLLGNKLAGLNNDRYRDVFHLRPSVEIVSVTPDGDIVVQGDLDLSGHRYASLNPNTQKTSVYGSGEVGFLTLRAGGDLSIHGSINDGFAPPTDTPDDGGWVLTPGVQAFGGDVLVPVGGVELADGTTYPKGKTLNYAITAKNVILPVGTRLPTAVTLDAPLTLPVGTVLAADVLAPDGSVLLAAGSVVQTAVLEVPAGSTLAAGMRLPASVTFASLTWPKGVELPVAMVQQGSKTLPLGAIIAAGTDIALPEGTVAVDLRPVDAEGRQAKNWAVAPMLAEGSQSWSMRLVAGADTASADNRLTRYGSDHAVVFADTHYAVLHTYENVSPAILVWAAGNLMNYPAGTPVAAEEQFLCELLAGSCIEQVPEPTYTWAPDNLMNYPAGTPVAAEEQFLCDLLPGSCIITMPEGEERLVAVKPTSPNISVVRTGTGDLDVLASGDLMTQSPYGIYTAGTSTSLGTESVDAAYNQARAKVQGGQVLGNNAGAYEALVDGGSSLYQAWYPDQGGNLLVSVGGDLTGDAWGATANINTTSGLLDKASTSIGNWLWRQGTGGGDFGEQPTAWWINFGTYVYDPFTSLTGSPVQQGFTGIGTLGGGNATIYVGGDAGIVSTRSTAYVQDNARSQGIVLAIGSSGRVLEDGSLVLTGGGDLDVRVGGGWNAHADARQLNANGTVAQTHDLYGGLVNLRGAISLVTGQAGTIELVYGGRQGQRDERETRATDPYTSSMTQSTGGLMLMPGDATVNVSSRGDLVLGGVGDPGRVHTGTYLDSVGQATGEGGVSWFTLWTSATAINALSAGGNLVADTRVGESLNSRTWDYRATDGFFMLPGSFSVVSGYGSIYYGTSAAYQTNAVAALGSYTLLLAPQGERQLEILAGDSIYGGGYAISQSGAEESAMATIFQPGFAVYGGTGVLQRSNTSEEGVSPTSLWQAPLLAFGRNNVGQTVGYGRSDDYAARMYARDGDIVGLRIGGALSFDMPGGVYSGQTWYLGAGPVAVKANRDIVYAGTLAGENELRLSAVVDGSNSGIGPLLTGNLFVHGNKNDVSVISAGRDILYNNLMIVGPGAVEISAGRNMVQDALANITSIGPVVAGDSRPGASIVVQAGLGVHGASYETFLAQYLNPANLASPDLPLADQEGMVAKTYGNELVEWLAERYGFEASSENTATDEALAYFASLAPEQQRIFAREVYFAELREGGREYNDADGPRPGSYLRGRNAIAALFPTEDAEGNEIAYGGDLLMYGGAGIHTNIGGDIQVLTPGGSQTYGVEGPQPPATAGLITRGKGNIQLYSLDSILLGQSRIMTTFGGDILAWSAQGDINAGRGSRTTVVYTPPRRVYDDVGNVTISPDVPSTGAGIATLNPIPEVEPGDVDLIAPLGTIDAGEAGVRVSGNVNIAALQVVNAANIQVQGEATGIPVMAAVNVGALSSASAAASSATQAASDVMRQQQAAARQNQPSLISVQILGFGDEAL